MNELGAFRQVCVRTSVCMDKSMCFRNRSSDGQTCVHKGWAYLGSGIGYAEDVSSL